ncbi:MAG TPA: HAMP domain-containing protein [Anaerolineae bacterium]|nr:HAMP domain-containing protein [Anaerolineae bacterium]
MRLNLQQRLTLSHLAVTIISVAILTILGLAGYFLYLRSDLAAAWAGDIAEEYAAELAFWTEEGSLDDLLAQEYIDATLGTSALITAEEADSAEWLIVVAPDGRILSSNFIDQYQSGESSAGLPAFNPDADPNRTYFSTLNGASVGQAPITGGNGRLLGWVYYRFPDDTRFLLSDAARSAILAALGAAIIAVIISGAVGSLLARQFSRRLNALSQASVAFAAGDLARRVPLQGNDEITQLGAQFNRMAGQISRQMQELRQLAETNARLAEEAQALAALEERNRLARELHDAIKQQLFGLGLTAASAKQLLTANPDKAGKRLEQITEMAQQIQTEMDNIIKQLRPSSLNDKGLAEALESLCAAWQTQTGIALDLSIHQARPLPLEIEHGLYRVAQEALNNIARHAQANKVVVTLTYEQTAVRLHIADDGLGFDPSQRKSASLGLKNMAERLAGLDGRLIIDSQPGHGAAITAQVPIQETLYV